MGWRGLREGKDRVGRRRSCQRRSKNYMNLKSAGRSVACCRLPMFQDLVALVAMRKVNHSDTAQIRNNTELQVDDAYIYSTAPQPSLREWSSIDDMLTKASLRAMACMSESESVMRTSRTRRQQWLASLDNFVNLGPLSVTAAPIKVSPMASLTGH
jgi:hypothetical protein